MSRDLRTSGLAAVLIISFLTLGAVRLIGQGGTGKEKPGPNANRKLPAAKKTPAQKASKTNDSNPSGLVTRTNQIGIEFVLIPPGSFLMGSETGRQNEKPMHQVTINYSFYIGKYEVTQGQWQAVMGSNPSYFKGCGANCPVDSVTWNAAQEFIRKLNQTNDGFTYRLPSEAEWEYACRAGTTGDYAGDFKKMAWYSDNSEKRTRPVGQKQPNAWGLFDMNGNIFEWCEDRYHNTHDGAPVDGGPRLDYRDRSDYRVIRGGSWFYDASYLRSAYRTYYDPWDRFGINGFRLVSVALSH
ncbi:MAG: formylglycine-generating enzyme family protein [Acidobacteriota bacterium]